MKKRKKELSGTITYKELYNFLGISKDTLRRRLVPLRPFLDRNDSGNKRFYSETEWQFILKNIRL